MSQFSHAAALPCRGCSDVQATNLETDVECVPRPRQWVCSFELQNRRKCCCFIPALTENVRHWHHADAREPIPPCLPPRHSRVRETASPHYWPFSPNLGRSVVNQNARQFEVGSFGSPV